MTDFSPPDQAVLSPDSEETQRLLARSREAWDKLHTQVSRVVVGQDQVVEEVFLALFTRGHALLVGVPGLAKTLLVSTVARSLSLQFNRIQFTPDLMPSDITGTEVIDEDRTTGQRALRFVKGPVFCNVLLADEINRTPPKTQAALLEAMQERHVTAGGMQHALPQPFFCLATQNPIEQEGTYPLPEAQLDRFMFMIRVTYPDESQELEILRRTTARMEQDVEPVLTGEEVQELQQLIREVPVPEHVARYALRLVRATRVPERGQPDARTESVKKYVQWGAGPRASQNLILAGKARAVFRGRSHVEADDVKALAPAVLRHRVILNFNAEADNLSTDDLIQQLLEEITVAPPADPQAVAVLR